MSKAEKSRSAGKRCFMVEERLKSAWFLVLRALLGRIRKEKRLKSASFLVLGASLRKRRVGKEMEEVSCCVGFRIENLYFNEAPRTKNQAQVASRLNMLR